MDWAQGYLGYDAFNAASSDPVLSLFSIRSIPTIYLIDPEGNIVGENLRGEGIYKAVEKALSSTD